MAFRYPKEAIKRVTRADLTKTQEASYLPGEELTGFIRGQPAGSKNEERIAIGLNKMGLSFSYQYPVDTQFTLPDGAKKVDFVVYRAGRSHPLEHYGAQYHSTDAARFRDQQREDELNTVFNRWGWENLQVIEEHHTITQEATDSRLRWLFG